MRAQIERRGAVLVCFWLIVCLGAATPSASAADLFYEQLVQSGKSALERGDSGRAASDLRIACFGLLDEPPRLVECLTFLAVAQAEVADIDAFMHTFDRLLEVERLFQSYSQMTIDPRIRGAFETHVENSIPFETLERSSVFRDLGRRKRIAAILALPMPARREELGRRLAAEPQDPTWRLMMAEIDLADGAFENAWSAANELEGQIPPQRLACLRGRSAAALGQCEQAFADLANCVEPAFVLEVSEHKVRCAMQLGDLDGAEHALSQLPVAERQRNPFRQLARDLAKQKRAAARAARRAPQVAPDPAVDPSSSPEVVEGQASPPAGDVQLSGDTEVDDRAAIAEASDTPETDTPEPPPVAPPAVEAQPATEVEPSATQRAEAEVEELGKAARRASSRNELNDIFEQAQRLADSNPSVTSAQTLAAETAYRLSLWQDAVRYFERAGARDGFPEQQFYFAVALFEAGDRAAAKALLDRCLPSIEQTDFVRSYANKISGAS